MPRYRFQWEVVPAPVSQALCRDLGLSGQPVAELRGTFGARPKEDFVDSCWPTLLAAWLSNDNASRHSIVGELRNRGLGDLSCSVSSADEELNYLKSCRNSKTLREVVLAAFFPLGEPAAPTVAELAHAGEQMRSGQRAAQSPPVATAREASAKEGSAKEEEPKTLAGWLLATLRAALEVPKLEPDEDGDIPVSRGSSVAFVRAVEDPKGQSFVRVFAPMVKGLEPRFEVFEALNTINLQTDIARAFLTKDGTAMLAADTTAATLSPSELMFVLDLVLGSADYYDSLLKARFGGMTMLSEEAEEGLDV